MEFLCQIKCSKEYWDHLLNVNELCTICLFKRVTHLEFTAELQFLLTNKARKTFQEVNTSLQISCYLPLSYSTSKNKKVILELRDVARCLSLNKIDPQSKSVLEKINAILHTYSTSFLGTFSDFQLSPGEDSDDYRIQEHHCKLSDVWFTLL